MRFHNVLKTRQGKPINLGNSRIDNKIKKMCLKHHIKLFYIYGSYSVGNPGRLSDLDLAYLSDVQISWEEETKLLEEATEIFEEEAIDLVDLKKVPLTLIHRILKWGKCLYAKDLKTKIDFETRKEDEYFDTEPIRKEYFKNMLERIENGAFWA